VIVLLLVYIHMRGAPGPDSATGNCDAPGAA